VTSPRLFRSSLSAVRRVCSGSGPSRLDGELALSAHFQSSKCRGHLGMDGRSQGIAVIAPCLPSSELAFEESTVRSVRHRNGSSGPLQTFASSISLPESSCPTVRGGALLSLDPGLAGRAQQGPRAQVAQWSSGVVGRPRSALSQCHRAVRRQVSRLSMGRPKWRSTSRPSAVTWCTTA